MSICVLCGEEHENAMTSERLDQLRVEHNAEHLQQLSVFLQQLNQGMVPSLIVTFDPGHPDEDDGPTVHVDMGFIARDNTSQFISRLEEVFYILDDEHHIQRATGVQVWDTWMQNFNNRIVAQTDINDDLRVSTVFIGINLQSDPDKPPVLFETMIHEAHHGFYHASRYETYEQAQQGHQQIVHDIQVALMNREENVKCSECGVEHLEIFYTGKTWNETLCELCFQQREAAGLAKERGA